MVLIWRLKHRRETLIEGEIRDKRDQPNQRIGDQSAQHTDDQRHPRENDNPPIPRKIRQRIFDSFYNLIHLINTSLITYLSRQRTPSVVKINLQCVCPFSSQDWIPREVRGNYEITKAAQL